MSNQEEEDDANKEDAKTQLASVRQVFSFGTAATPPLLMAGLMCAAVSGLVGPFMVFYFAKAYSDLSGDPTSEEFMDNVRHLSFIFLVLGAVAFLSLSAYSAFLQTAAQQMTNSFKEKWYVQYYFD